MKIKYLLIVFILTQFFGEKLVANERKDFMIVQYNNHSLLKYLHGKGIPEKDLPFLLNYPKNLQLLSLLNRANLTLSSISTVIFISEIENNQRGAFLIKMQRNLNLESELMLKNELQKTNISDVFKITGKKNLLVSYHKGYYLIADEVWQKRVKKELTSQIPANLKMNDILQVKVEIAQYLREQMSNAMEKGKQYGQGMDSNVFLSALTKIRSVELGLLNNPAAVSIRINGESTYNAHRILMVAHTLIVGSSIAVTVAGQSLAHIGKGRANSSKEVSQKIQELFGRIETKQIKQRVELSVKFKDSDQLELINRIKEEIKNRKGQFPEELKKFKVTKLTQAVREKNIPLVKTAGKIVLNGSDDFGRSALNTAIQEQNLTIFKLLHESGADINLADQNQDCPLIFAIQSKETEIIDYLLAQNPDLQVTNKNKNTALHIAASHNSMTVVEKLLKLGARRDIPNKFGQKPYQLATDAAVAELLKPENSEH